MKITKFGRFLLSLGLIALAAFALATSAKADTIHPISREDGSGTRGAFVEIFGIQKEVKGKKIDNISPRAEITNSTAVMLSTVANDKNAIGFVSLGSLANSVKALKIEGVEPSVANVKAKKYPIFRPFNVVTKSQNALISDFLAFITSKEAENIITKAAYIPLGVANFSSKKPSGKLVIAGSSSITPLMEKLKDAYLMLNSNAKIEIQQSDSTTGINATAQGIADIGMVSREVRQSELDKGLQAQVIAIDGLALIVHPQNSTNSLNKTQVKGIFEGSIKKWSELR